MMSQHNYQHQAPEVSAPPQTPVMAYPPHQAPTEGYVHVTPPPPPAGYPTMEVSANHQNSSNRETKTRGEGFWKGCVAALCCCWVLECCCGD